MEELEFENTGTENEVENIEPKNNLEEKPEESQIFIIKVTTNKEDRALELISDKIHKKNLLVYSLARPHGLRGYIFLEAADRENAEEAAYNLPYVKGIIGKTVSYDEIKNMIEQVLEEINIEKGDIVEIIGEPFKKEKAKVIRVDKPKGEVVVTLLAAVVPIPVTVKLDNVKVIRREKEPTEGEESELIDTETPMGDSPEISRGDNFSGSLIPEDY